MGGERNQLSSLSGIIYGHFIILVRDKQTQMSLQSNPKRYYLISTKF